jgi:hypothetical protein
MEPPHLIDFGKRLASFADGLTVLGKRQHEFIH